MSEKMLFVGAVNKMNGNECNANKTEKMLRLRLYTTISKQSHEQCYKHVHRFSHMTLLLSFAFWFFVFSFLFSRGWRGVLHTLIVFNPLADPVVMQKAVDSAPVKPTKMIINSPNNPTGLLIQNPNDVARFCQDNDIVMISDEIYDGVTSDSAWTTQAPLAPQHTIITTGLSKSFSLGGWRIGTLHIPKSMTGLANAIQTIASETWSAVPSPMQRVAINAYLPNPSLDAYVAECASIHHQVCTFLAKELRALGVSCPLHKGAFYIYPNFNSFRDALAQRGVQSSADLSTFLLTNYNIVSLPASAFGDEENLCLRLAVTAYDGQHALDLLRLDPNTPLDMTQAAPKVVKGAEYFGDFIRDLNQ
eukprot:m.199409 g.199409  ORF g.199409 m.199409 type:complete len:362 (-) comp14942_c0_seq1:392-1477(-)